MKSQADSITSIPVHKQNNLKISTLPALMRAHGAQIVRTSTTSFEDLLIRFSKPRIGPKDGPAYVFTTFKDNRRLKANALECYCLVFDIDNAGVEATVLEDLLPELEGRSYIAHSSYSHAPHCPRFRLILPLSAPIPAADYSGVFQDAWRRLGSPVGVDLKAGQPERAYYFPAVKEENKVQFWYQSNIGKPWEYDLPEIRSVSVSTVSAFPDVTIPPWKDKDIPLPSGDRNDALFRLACSYRNRGDDEQDAWLLLSKQNDTRCVPPLPEAELKAIIKNVYTRYPSGDAQVLADNPHSPPPGAPAKKKKKQEEDQQMIADNFLAKYGAESVITQADSVYLWEEKAGLWAKKSDMTMRNLLQKCCIDRLNIPKINNALQLLKAYTVRDAHEWNSSPNRIPVQNGELILTPEGWRLEAYRRESYFTYQLQVRYDPKAEAPRFEQFIQEIFVGHAEPEKHRQLLLEAMGYTLTPMTSFHKAFWLVGRGANGKSVLLSVLSNLLGPNVQASIPAEALGESHQRAHLFGKLANIVSEVKPNELSSIGILKSIISGDPIHADEKFKPPFTFTPTCKIWFATNELPHVADHSDGFYRRVILFEFRNQFLGESRDCELTNKLKSESPGILLLALKALEALLRNDKFSEFAEIDEKVKEWRRENNATIEFIEDFLIEDPQGSVPTKALYDCYKTWMLENGYERPYGQKRLFTQIQLLLPNIARGKLDRSTRAIYGIRFTDAPPFPNPPSRIDFNSL